jgi:hypothetical protein
VSCPATAAALSTVSVEDEVLLHENTATRKIAARTLENFIGEGFGNGNIGIPVHGSQLTVHSSQIRNAVTVEIVKKHEFLCDVCIMDLENPDR